MIKKYSGPFFEYTSKTKRGFTIVKPLMLGIVCLYNYLAAITRAISQTLFE